MSAVQKLLIGLAGLVILALIAVASGPPVTLSIKASTTLDPWPFTPRTVVIECVVGRVGDVRTNAVFVTAPGGARYALNGTARANAPLSTPIQAHFDTQPAIARGLELCERGGGAVALRAPADAAPTETVAGASSVGPSQLGGLEFSSSMAAAIDGERPEIGVSCGSGEPHAGFYLKRAPATPPPLRGNFATVRIDGGRAQRIEMSWLPEASWSPRDDTDFDRARLARAIVRATSVTIEGLDRYAPTPVSWQIGLSDQDRRRMARACA